MREVEDVESEPGGLRDHSIVLCVPGRKGGVLRIAFDSADDEERWMNGLLAAIPNGRPRSQVWCSRLSL